MNILGIHDGHNATVALFQGDRVTYALSEERLSRRKNEGGFPARALDRVLEETGLAPTDIARVIFTTNNAHAAAWRDHDALLERYAATLQVKRPADLALPWRFLRAARILVAQWRQTPMRRSVVITRARTARMQPLIDRGFRSEQVGTMDHHMSHAVSAYVAAHRFDDDVLVLTSDGGGDGLCASVSVGRAGRLERLAAIPVRNSIASLYARATHLLGMTPLEHEYKLMGLAPYAKEELIAPLAARLVAAFEWPSDAPFTWRLRDEYPTVNHVGAALPRIFHRVRFDVVAGAMQRFIEDMAIRWVRQCVQETGISHLAVAGGLFMNVKLNQKILALLEVRSLYVMPSCGDESTPFGACYWGALSLGVAPDDIRPLESLGLGPSYTLTDIEHAIRDASLDGRVSVTTPSVIEDAVADLLASGEIVAWYQDREEFGARALGHRSILANPSMPGVTQRLNQAIKSRDFWMPFAGSMTGGQAQRVLVNPKQHVAPYMIMTFDVRERLGDFLAATHPYDQTIRPQVVEQSWDPSYHRVIEAFEQRSGKQGGVLNTSFNLHGFPIVSSPADAIDVFLRSGLTHLALGPFLLTKAARVS